MVTRRHPESEDRRRHVSGRRWGDDRLPLVLEALPVPVLVLAPDLRPVLLNGTMRQMLERYGHDVAAFAVTPSLDFIAPEDRGAAAAAVQQAFETGRATIKATTLTRDGRPVPISLTGVRVDAEGEPLLAVIVTDLTDHHDLVHRLVHAQKMESLGRLAGGVAHDFNNLLVAVMSFTEVALLDTAGDDPRREDLESIREAVLQAAELTRMLLAFGRRQLLMPKRVELNAQVLELDKMLRRMIGEDIELVFLPGADVGAVRVDPGQLESALLNLAVHARDAMPDGGTLTITTSSFAEGPRRWVRISVADSGPGLAPEARGRLFEPFSATSSGSSGLGLASVYGFVEQSGGRLDVLSAPGEGTTFNLDLPELAGERVGAASEGARPAPAHGETVLLAEDNPRARRGVALMLRAMGYAVLEAEHGEHALEVAAAHEGPIALLLSDVVMPRMPVTAVVEWMRAARPETRVLLMSGYTDDALVRAGVQAGAVAFLPKPFTAQILAAKLAEVLA